MNGAGSDELKFARPHSGEVPMRRQELTFADGCTVEVFRYGPPGGASGAPVLYVHGIQSHPGWFSASAEALARAGREVFQVTRRGSGTARTGRGDAPSAGRLLEDVAEAVACVRARTQASRVALVGVSWGGKLLTAWVLRAGGGQAESLTLVAPGIVPRVGVSAATKLAIGAARLVQPRRRFPIPLDAPALFTDNPRMQAYLSGDRHRLRRATARLMAASAALDWSIRRARPGALKLPTTLLLAARDRIIDNDATRSVLERLTAGAVRVERLDAAHTMEFEPDPAPFHELLCRAVARGNGS